MNKDEEIKKLETDIKFYQDDYYKGGQLISDYEFDKMWDRLKFLDPSNPILQAVGSDLDDDSDDTDGMTGFQKMKHVIPMGSQQKAKNPEEFLDWAKKHKYPEYLVEFKLDGASLELQYVDGVFKEAVTRGDGLIGDKITANVSKMKGVVKKLKDDFTGGIRGEVLMDHNTHKTIFSDKANCRNAASGLMKRQDGTGSEHLMVIVYDATSTEGDFFDTEEEKIEWLKAQGFETVKTVVVNSIEDVIDYRAQVMDSRASLPYDIDGLVIKNNEIDQDDLAQHRPDKQIAFKFSLDEAITTLNAVRWSEKGSTYTPVGQVEPVQLCGTTVRQANLCNPGLMERLGVMIGSKIIITKRGEIIPKIESLVDNPPGCTPIEIPTKCGCCGADLINAGTRLYCPNPSCDKKGTHQIMKWVNTLGIMDIGPAFIKQAYDDGVVTSIYGLYAAGASDFANVVGAKTAEKIVKNRDAIKVVSLPQFVAGFDIEDVGETVTAKLIKEGHNSLDKLLALKVSDLAGIPGIGTSTAEKIVRGLADNKDEMTRLAKDFVEIEQVKTGGKLAGKSFCFTGALSIKRSEAEKMVIDAGGTASGSVGKSLSYLVSGDPDPTSGKGLKAQQLGIPIITEDEFLAML